MYPNGSGVQFDNHYILPRIKGNFVLQPIQSSLSALTPKKAIIRVVEIREHALSTGEDGLISLLEELVAADIDKPYVISMNRYIARDVATLIAGVCNAEPVDLLGHQVYTI